GLSKGKKLAVMLPNCTEFLFLLFGAAKIGAVTVPVNTAYKGQLLAHVLSNSDAELLVVDDQFLPIIGEIISELPGLRNVLVYSDGEAESQSTALSRPINVQPLASLFEHSDQNSDCDIRHTDPVMILYTGGTTGPSKGVVMTNHFYYFYSQLVAG